MTVIAYRIAAVLWIIWGLVHVLAGTMTMAGDAAAGFAGIADATDAAVYALDFPPAVGAVLNQHGWNLAWIGLTTLVCAPFVWKGERAAVLVAALTGGMADLGYFLFLDLGGFVHFLPGTLMTLVSGSAIVISFVATFRGGAAD